MVHVYTIDTGGWAATLLHGHLWARALRAARYHAVPVLLLPLHHFLHADPTQVHRAGHTGQRVTLQGNNFKRLNVYSRPTRVWK